MTKPTWTTLDGKKIPYNELEDDHLDNIIKDGYRNPELIQEALKRDIPVPVREVDKLTIERHKQFIDALYSCAINVRNKGANYMCKLYEEDRPMYYLALNRLLEGDKKNNLKK